jgi:hypothetical protein
MLAKDGKIIADDDAEVSFESDRVVIDGRDRQASGGCHALRKSA